MSARRLCAAVAGVVLALAALGAAAGPAGAQIPPNCSELCGTRCLKPIAFPDRWDDATPIAGYALWRYDGRYDFEAYSDVNGNGLHDVDEPFVDKNGNGVFDQEAYDPLLTGYIADPVAGNPLAPNGDAGGLITLASDNGSVAPIPGNYLPVDFPPINEGTPLSGTDAYRENWAVCNPGVVDPADELQIEPGSNAGPTSQAMADLIAQDPNAYWDPVTMSVQGSAFAPSPRVILVAAYDPRTFPTPGRTSVSVAKVVPFFMERLVGYAQVAGHFVRLETTGTVCASASAGGWLYACATPATRATWGRVKASYR